ncbi:MAG: Fe-S protein assembly co-chaperone HscB [Planctomycetia bacterium]|nr:Fe-S protein assembly co-chaperone HscB [Planctomycetia bacterium]
MQIPFENNYFDLFSIEKSYSLDRHQLRDRFRELQRQFHPDNFASATEQDRRISAQYAAMINEAFTTLNDPVQRGRYMLSLNGINTDDEHDTRMDPEFLMQQIELREELDAARSSSLDALNQLSDKVESDFAGRTALVGEILDGTDDNELEKARHLVRELQFLSRMRNEIEEAEESFF